MSYMMSPTTSLWSKRSSSKSVSPRTTTEHTSAWSRMRSKTSSTQTPFSSPSNPRIPIRGGSLTLRKSLRKSPSWQPRGPYKAKKFAAPWTNRSRNFITISTEGLHQSTSCSRTYLWKVIAGVIERRRKWANSTLISCKNGDMVPAMSV